MLRRVALAIPLIVAGVILGKTCQYLAVDLLGGSLGFELSSLIGLAPVIALLLLAKRRWPHLLRLRRA
ncbi:hypothetical protein COC42_04950 [Sphingomonas spermidinifaciens]|uniref:Uncharacterized protein n=1 Tax=Sphingomonas spermidinifaciens TaxID=1141889 RepID=A0A2A4B3C9_9SPHN|nr:hypothetical protein [Sphingomonas spermidinifaciens]PCD03703.1 hypothetical protein COC42_04950 [Sphingomonas spermidinifaciens]